MQKLPIASLVAVLLVSVSALSGEPLPKYGPDAVPLSARTNVEYFQKNPAPDYWTLSPYYIPQLTKTGCSAANLSMILNAARVGMKLTADDKLVTFNGLTEKYASDPYSSAIQGKTPPTDGVFANRNLAKVLKEAAEKLKLPSGKLKVDFHEVDQKKPGREYKSFVSDLKKNEKSANDYMFFSFVQGKVTGDPEGEAHVATVAAYDAKKDLVLVMDPDREWYEPYWTPSKKLFEAISNPASDSEKRVGWIYFTVR
jgi:hypothetical protein